MSSDGNRKGLKSILKPALVSCGCGKPKLSDVVQPTPVTSSSSRPHVSKEHTAPTTADHLSSSSASTDYHHRPAYVVTPSSTFSLTNIHDTSSPSHSVDSSSETDPTTTSTSSAAAHPAELERLRISNSIAVAKDSDDPYQDFRSSMLQMILEREIYTSEGLEELLHCFLKLNSPCYYSVIIRAFTEVWNGVVSSDRRSATSASTEKNDGGSSVGTRRAT